MSVTPNNLPKRTRVLAKDFLFQEKHQLTDTQVDIMSYIFNAFTWAMKINGYMVLTSKKIMDDLPQIGAKTLDASLLELANKGLITRSLVTVKIWRNARVRGIKITSDGMEYNSSMYTPTHQAIVNVCQERIAELEEENRALKAKEEIEETEASTPKNEPVEEKNEAKAVDSVEKNRVSKSEEMEASTPKNEPVEEKSEAKAVDSVEENRVSKTEKTEASAPKNKPIEPPITETLDSFVRRVRNRFILTSEPICNSVEGWQKETTFYINSYGKLSLTTKNKEFSQLNDPISINKFWKWLMNHQERIGDVVEFNRDKVDVTALNQKYKNSKIKIDGKIRWIERIIDMGSGLHLKIRDEDGDISMVCDGEDKPRVYGYEVFKM